MPTPLDPGTPPDSLMYWPAAERNRGPILEALREHLPAACRVLEIASGTGQHAVHMVGSESGWSWQPTDLEPDRVASIDRFVAYVGLAAEARLAPARRLDVTARPWALPPGPFDAVYCANMIHIAPWRCAEALVAGAAEVLEPGGRLVLYGPFKVGGGHTAPSNAAFDASLRARDPSWGVRDREAVEALAAAAGLTLTAAVAMPANNQTLVFDKGRSGGSVALSAEADLGP